MECAEPLVVHVLNADVVRVSVSTALSFLVQANVHSCRLMLPVLRHMKIENGIIDRHHGDSFLSRDSQRAIILKDANYEHKFQYAQLHNDSNGNTLHECIICAKHLRAVQISESKKPSLILNDTEKDSNVSHKRAKGSEIAWEYRCGMIVCGICKDAYTKVHAAMP